MALTLTDKTTMKTLETMKRLQIAISIADVAGVYGTDNIIGSGVVYTPIRIGDGHYVDGSWVIGGRDATEGQAFEPVITLEGSSTKIDQQLNVDDASGSSISQFDVALIDKNGTITQLITPGEVVEDMLGRAVKVYLGFEDTSFPDDFIRVFSGVVQKITSKAGVVVFTIAHPDNKKRQELFLKADTELDGAIDDDDTSVVVNDASQFLSPVLGPDGENDPTLTFYLLIDDEIMQYTEIVDETFTVSQRGCFGTTAAAHEDDASVSSFYSLTGNAMDLALKLMLSGVNDYFIEEVPIHNFEKLGDDSSLDNAIQFSGIDVEESYGLVVGDYITTTGASNGANNEELKPILSIGKNAMGSYIVVDDVTFVEELSSAAVAAFRSQYDTLGEGLGMNPDEVDVTEHLRIKNEFLSSFEYLFYIKDMFNGKEFIDGEIYKPCGAFSVPRKARCSVGYHSPPGPGDDTKILDATNVLNPKGLVITRSLTQNFYNTIIYQYEEDPLEDKFYRQVVHINSDSLAQIPVGKRALIIKSKGMRSTLQAEINANIIASRRLDRYKYGAETLPVDVMLGTGVTIEIGDVVVFDGRELSVSDITQGSREFSPRFFEVINKSSDLKTGKTSLTLIDTNYATGARRGKIGPSSLVASGLSQTQFTIKPSFAMKYGANEYLKWSRYVGKVVLRVRSPDGATSGTAYLSAVDGSLLTVDEALGFIPAANYIVELAPYDLQDPTLLLIYAYMTDEATFDDGKPPFQMI
jgi:hypothetical protein